MGAKRHQIRVTISVNRTLDYTLERRHEIFPDKCALLQRSLIDVWPYFLDPAITLMAKFRSDRGK